MKTFRTLLDEAIATNADVLIQLQKMFSEIDDNAISGKSYVEIAKMIPNDFSLEQQDKVDFYCDKNTYCDSVIDIYETNIDFLYEQYTLNSHEYKHIKVVVISFLVAAIVALVGYLSLTISAGALVYYFLSRKQFRESIEEMKFHEWHIDSIVNLKADIDKIKELKG